MSDVVWDYTTLADAYDKRPDYAPEAIERLLALTATPKAQPVAEIGAGTGKLTRALVARGYTVHAVEPNDAMRAHGVENTAGMPVTWSVGTGEASGLAAGAYDLAAFGSSFNVTDRARTLVEVARILKPGGWFCCMWNHRDLADANQARCQEIIQRMVPGFSHGSRREDQSGVIRESGLYEEPVVLEGRVVHTVSRVDFIEAWRSHATLERQAGALFPDVIRALDEGIGGAAELAVPYSTRVFCARLRAA